MRRHIEHLRTKPDHVKRKIAFGLSSGITFMIFLFWLGTFTLEPVPDGNAAALARAEQVATSSLPTPFRTAYKNAAGVFGAFKDFWSGRHIYEVNENGLEVVGGGGPKF